MKFGERVRSLRIQQQMTQQTLAKRLCVSMSYISKVERGQLQSGDYPSEKFIRKLSIELDTDEDELLLLADKVPQSIRERIRQRPSLFRRLASLNCEQLDEVEAALKSAT